jgi:hypothetical protein
MAVPTGSGTEVLTAHHFDGMDDTDAHALIIGVKHHTYTVLSTIAYCIAINAADDIMKLQLLGYGSHESNSGETMIICQWVPAVGDTFVWNDKFSFFGAEPTAYTAPLSTAAEQLAIKTQGSTVEQSYQMTVEHAGDDFDVHVTFIDQDWT